MESSYTGGGRGDCRAQVRQKRWLQAGGGGRQTHMRINPNATLGGKNKHLFGILNKAVNIICTSFYSVIYTSVLSHL